MRRNDGMGSRHRSLRSLRGVALVTVLGVSIIVALLAASVAQLAAQYYQLQRQQIRRTLFHYLASSGIKQGTMELFRRADFLAIPAAEKRSNWVPFGAPRIYSLLIDDDGAPETPPVSVEVKITRLGADQFEVKATVPAP